jgi:sulfonate transport system permease protein
VPRGLQRLAGPLLLLAAWWALTASGAIRPQVLASPGAVLEASGNLLATGQLQEHLLISLRRAMTGLALGVGIGVSLAVVSGLYRLGENLIDATMQMLRAMPILALVPLAIIWFGIGEEVKVILVALGVTFPMYLNTHASIRSVDSRFVDLAATLGLGRADLVRRVILPGALPGFFTGLRFAVAISWLVLVVSEQINAASGIGFLMSQARGFNQTDIIVVGLVVYALLGLTSDTVVRAIERRALVWRSTLEAR